jgi:hypothetical protein
MNTRVDLERLNKEMNDMKEKFLKDLEILQAKFACSEEENAKLKEKLQKLEFTLKR